MTPRLDPVRLSQVPKTIPAPPPGVVRVSRSARARVSAERQARAALHAHATAVAAGLHRLRLAVDVPHTHQAHCVALWELAVADVEAAFAVELRALAQQLAQWHDRVERSAKACAPPFADDGEETGDVVWLRG